MPRRGRSKTAGESIADKKSGQVRFSAGSQVVLLVLVAALTVIVASSWLEIRGVERASAVGGEVSRDDTHSMISTTTPDSLWWVLFGEKVLRDGSSHFTSRDNAPLGREVHWSSLPAEMLAGLAQLGNLLPGPAALTKVERASLLFGPLMLSFFLILWTVVAYMKLGVGAAASVPPGVLAAQPFFFSFMPGDVDHHGLVACLLGTSLFCLICGSGQSSRSKAWSVAAGGVAGVALWVSASTALPFLAACGLGGLLAMRFSSGRRGFRPAPEDWFAWGVAGCATSLVGYAVEYFPGGMGWRMEVNHPLYALAWLGGSFLLRTAGVALRDGFAIALAKPRTRWALASSVLAVLAPLGIIFAGRERVFAVADPFLYSLHHLYISEFRSVFAMMAEHGWQMAVVANAFFLLAIVVCAFSLPGGALPPAAFLALAPAVAGWALAAWQIRWSGAAAAVSLPLLAVAMGRLSRQLSVKPPFCWRPLLAWLLLLLSGSLIPAEVFQQILSSVEGKEGLGRDQIRMLAYRDVARLITGSAGGDTATVLASPHASTYLIYYGNIRGLGTLYWENAAGLKRASRIYSAMGESEALTQLKEAGVSYVALFSWDHFTPQYTGLARGAETGKAVEPGWVERLVRGEESPHWLSPMACPFFGDATHPEGSPPGDWVRVFEVVPDQSEAAWRAARGAYFLGMGNHSAAAAEMRQAVKADSRHTSSHLGRIALAAVFGPDAELEAAVSDARLGCGEEIVPAIRSVAANIGRAHPDAAQAINRVLSGSGNDSHPRPVEQ